MPKDTDPAILRLTHMGKEVAFFTIPTAMLPSVKDKISAIRAMLVTDSNASLAASHTEMSKALNRLLTFLDNLPYCSEYKDIVDLLRQLNEIKKMAEKFRLTAAEAAALETPEPTNE